MTRDYQHNPDLNANAVRIGCGEAVGPFASRDVVAEAALLEMLAVAGDEDARLALCEFALESIKLGKGIAATPAHWNSVLRRIIDGGQIA